MKLDPYIQKLSGTNQYKEFQRKNGDAFLVAGFFVLDLESGQSLHQIDYYVPSKKKVAAFTLDKSITLQMLDLLGTKIPSKLEEKTKIDLDSLKGILEDEMKNRSITEEIRKIIAVVQNVDGKVIWNLNCILSGMSILNAHIEDDSETVLKMERKSLVDIARAIPANELRKHIQLPGGPEPLDGDAQGIANSVSEAEASGVKSNEIKEKGEPGVKNEGAEALERIKKLEVLEEAIRKEKEQLMKVSEEKINKKNNFRDKKQNGRKGKAEK